MNRNHLILLLAGVIVFGSLGLWYQQSRDESYRSGSAGMGAKLLADLPVNDVAQITIRQATGELNLTRKDDGWQVKERDGYKASFQNISDFLRKAAELKVVQSEKAGPSQLPRLELLQPGKDTNGTGTLVEFRDKDSKPLRAILLGKKQVKKTEQASPFGGGGEFPVGRWVMDPKSNGEVALVSEVFNEIEARPEQWLDKEFVRIEKVRTIRYLPSSATNAWSLVRENESGEWKLVDAKPGEQLDPAKASALGNPFASAAFTDVAIGRKPTETGLDKPTVIELETFDQFTYTLKVGAKSGEEASHFAVAVSAKSLPPRVLGKDEKPEDKTRLDKEHADKTKAQQDKLASEKRFEKWTYLVSRWTVDPLLKDRAHFLAEKKPEGPAPKPDAPKQP
ncbi:MAG: DUF4340 domain-containing protein [Pedosphaera sp.]|nr:DUF4340 domain-containing protein [Pedosphaera sp.]MSS99950.1 DUF4340 domain-containing protein [Pedosphaera sp.]